MDRMEMTSASKFMSLVLRHAPQKAGITLDQNGWADAGALVAAMCRSGHNVTIEALEDIVAADGKQRFRFNGDHTMIRASQGHSVDVDVEPREAVPPAVLYHGTATKYIQAIRGGGLIPKSRLYVHLSGDAETAAKVGGRHGEAVVLTIDSARMAEDGFRFYLSDNGVWMTKGVPTEYISQSSPEGP